MQQNLKELAQYKEQLKYAQSLIREGGGTGAKGLVRKLDRLLNFLESVETDLEMTGECPITLDMERLEAIEERNKWLSYLHHTDEP